MRRARTRTTPEAQGWASSGSRDHASWPAASLACCLPLPALLLQSPLADALRIASPVTKKQLLFVLPQCALLGNTRRSNVNSLPSDLVLSISCSAASNVGRQTPQQTQGALVCGNWCTALGQICRSERPSAVKCGTCRHLARNRASCSPCCSRGPRRIPLRGKGNVGNKPASAFHPGVRTARAKGLPLLAKQLKRPSAPRRIVGWFQQASLT